MTNVKVIQHINYLRDIIIFEEKENYKLYLQTCKTFWSMCVNSSSSSSSSSS
ncbi:hypothetical protein ACMBCN_00540 [Candidatus Liberibacter asiaticus]|nr:hypothetical protein [Candidatus Liberibacter asiaticus]